MLTELNYFCGKPAVTGQYEDFIATEDLGFDLTGEGEHVLVYLQKRDCNTIFVTEQLAKYVGILTKLVSYVGLKDRQAVTQQWFSLYILGHEPLDFSNFNLDGCQILNVTHHSKKLKIGKLKSNYFYLTLKMLSNKSELKAKLTLIKQHDVPNYLGEQRFGREQNNIIQAIKWANGEILIKDRKKCSFYLSAARSAIFNDVVSQQIAQNLHQTVFDGDILQLAGCSSWFVAKKDEQVLLQQRLENGGINIAAPVLGDSSLGTKDKTLEFELNCLQNWSSFHELFKKERIETTRCSLIIYPTQLNWQWLDNSNH